MAKRNDTKAPLKKGRAQFNLVGEAKVSDYTYKMENTYASGWTDNQMNLGIDCGNGNVVYCDLSGGYMDGGDSVLYVHGIKEEDGSKRDDWDNRFEIDWDDRFDEDILETVGDSCFIQVGIEKDAKGKTFTRRFLSGYDAVEYLQEHLEDGMVLNVKGTLAYSPYGDNVYQNKKVTSIYLSKAEPGKYKSTFTQTILLDHASIGKYNAEKRSYPIDAYVVDYVGSPKIDGEKVAIKTNLVFPKAMEFAVPEGKEAGIQKLLDTYFKVKKKTAINEIMVSGDLIEGAAIVDVSWDDVPADIKELVDCGIYTEEQAKAACAVGNGNRERRMVIRRPEVTYVGDGDDRTPTIQNDDKKYTVDDLVFIGQFLSDDSGQDDADEDDSAPFDEEGDADLEAMLADL